MKLSAQRSPASVKTGGSRRRRLRYLVWAATIAFAAVVLLCSIFYYRIVSFDGKDPIRQDLRADTGIVLGASLWNNKPSPGLQERLDHALELYDAGVFPRIIVTGGLDTGGAAITEAEGMRDYLMEHGVPEHLIFLDKDSRNTYENLRNAKLIMSSSGWSSAIIITHRYHGARAADIAETIGIVPNVSVTDSKVMNIPYHQTRETLAFVKWQLTKLRLAFG